MNPLYQAGLELQKFMEIQKWLFCFIGGLAAIRWGEARMTQDVDLSLFCGFGNEEKYIKKLLNTYKPRIADALNFAKANRVLLIAASNNVPVDISLSALPFEKEMIKRASSYLYYQGCELITCSAEDLIILKAFADRPIDWNDVERIKKLLI